MSKQTVDISYFFPVPIVPIISIFAFVYFFGTYIVMKHQCLHVYAQEFEGGGSATWQQVFGFLMACVYIGELIFIVYMGIKSAPVQSGLGFVPFIVTLAFHRILYRKYIAPIQYLSLQVAADVDSRDGELSHENRTDAIKTLYRQPALDGEQEERGPMPYRRTPAKPLSSTEDV
jgi:Calcium-dependent channel, 7TM region, putative phosphate